MVSRLAPGANSHPSLVFVNKVLFAHSRAHPLTCCLTAFVLQTFWPIESEMRTVLCPVENSADPEVSAGWSVVSTWREKRPCCCDHQRGASCSLGGRGGVAYARKIAMGDRLAGRGIRLCKGPEVGISLTHWSTERKFLLWGGLQQAGPVVWGLWGALAQHPGWLAGKKVSGTGAS